MAAEVLKLDSSLRDAAPPPADLNSAGRSYWQKVLADHVLDAEALDMLHGCCRLLDRAHQAALRVKKDGSYLTTKQGTVYPHPGITVQRQSLQAAERFRRALNLDSLPSNVDLPKVRRAAYK